MTNKPKRSKRRIPLTESNLSKLKNLIQTARRYISDRDYIELLDEKLDQAEVVSPDQVPSDVVEIDSVVRITDLERPGQLDYKLVFPRDANAGNHISVIAPLGSALLGTRVGDIVEVHAPARTRRIRIDSIVQPNAHAA